METREAALQQLRQATLVMDWHTVPGTLFRLLYELPTAIQLEAARFPMLRYLPTFEQRWSSVSWPARLLSDPVGWVAQHGRGLRDEPAETGPADSAFLGGCDALVLAVARQEDPGMLTSSCVYCADRGIDAHFVAVWERDDPEAVRIWQRQAEPGGHDSAPLLEGRTALDHEAAMQVRRAEWLALVGSLNEQLVGAPSVRDVASMERDLQRWADREYSLLAG